ncbi:MAG: CheR family methyltransferase [Acidobacteriaceae bacterium]|jgi:chemotaxis protein methyltransferase WspC
MKASPIVVQTVTDRLQAAIGVDPRGLDAKRLQWIIGSRCRLLNLPDASAYAAHLEETPAEMDTLIDEVVVRETRFFRDLVVFDHIRHAIAQLAAGDSGPLRILSAPCGTGEEAYSLAAILQLVGLAPARFLIDAFDISPLALEIARRGVYPERTLSHAPAELQHACAQRQGGHWIVHEVLRERVRFGRRNLAQMGALGDAPQYHLILCRNLFIYLAPAARAALAQSLSAVLLPGGRMFLGTADRVKELHPLFAPVRPAASFAFVHRAPSAAMELRPRTAAARAAVPRLRDGWATTAASGKGGHARSPEVEGNDGQAATELLKRALEHRQRGELAKAERRCRQALYLAPNLLPALELLQLLWSEHPNLRIRRALRDRVLRHRLPRPAAAEAAPVKENA